MKRKVLVIYIIVGIIIALISIYAIYAGSSKILKNERSDLRKFPYPYKSMLALCSDIDGSTAEEFEKYHKFLNTNDITELGEGLGLDVGDSFWFFNGTDVEVPIDYKGTPVGGTMTYFYYLTDAKRNASLIKYYYDVGWIDSIHSYGDFSWEDETYTAFKREHAELAQKEMLENNFLPSVWINHGNSSNVQNIGNGTKNEYRQGDNVNTEYYHTDLIVNDIIKYVWLSNSDGRFCVDNPLYPVELKDGRKLWGFNRYTGEDERLNHRYNWSKYGVPEQLSEEHLTKLINEGKYSIVGQHFGGTNEYSAFSEDGIEALRRLASYYESGDILVARTSRLLNYARVYHNLNYEKIEEFDKLKINIISIDDPQLGESVPDIDEIRGITFYCENPKDAQITINNVPIEKELIQVNEEDLSIGIKWFEQDTTNYTWGAESFFH